MRFDLDNITRKNLLKLKPYSTARDDFKGMASIYLDANENPFESSYNRYPDPKQSQLKAELARIKKCRAEQIIIGNGSDELIDLLFRAFCEPGVDNVIIPQPTYGMYSVCAQINDIEVREPLLTDDYQLDLVLIRKNIDPQTKLIFLCSPNNPTGNLLETKSIVDLVTTFHGIVIVDEAYIDFAGNNGLLSQLDRYPNLVILQTLSKAWGLAGLRIGIGFASEEIAKLLTKIKPPYNISGVNQNIALEALRRREFKDQYLETILKERQILESQLINFSFVKRIFPSMANFLLVKMENAKACYEYLLTRGIVVRDRTSAPRCEDCLRISIGTPEENEKFIIELTNYQKIAQ